MRRRPGTRFANGGGSGVVELARRSFRFAFGPASRDLTERAGPERDDESLTAHPPDQPAAGLGAAGNRKSILAPTTPTAAAPADIGVPMGPLLDATIPALLVGQAVGRLGCIFAGCCSGLPTTSRWAIWGSDRRIGTRRIPVQALESAAAASLAVVTGLIVWRVPPEPAGFLFLGGLSAYLIVRQVLFPLRGLPRATRHGRTVMLIVAPVVLVASLATMALT